MTIPRVLVIDRCEDCLYCNQAAQWCGHSEAPGEAVRLAYIPAWCPLPEAYKLLKENKAGHYQIESLAQKLFNEAGYQGNVYKTDPVRLRFYENKARR